MEVIQDEAWGMDQLKTYVGSKIKKFIRVIEHWEQTAAWSEKKYKWTRQIRPH